MNAISTVIKRVLSTTALAVALLSSCTIGTAPDNVTGVAYLYGVAEYLETGHAYASDVNLTYTDDDAEDIGAAFAAAGYTVTIRTNSNATIANLRADIADAASLDPATNVVFSFSGHGSTLGNTTYALFADAFVAPDTSSYYVDLSGCLTPDQLKELFAQLPGSKNLFFLDICYSGAYTDSDGSGDIYPEDYDGAETNSSLSEAWSAYWAADTSDLTNGLVLSTSGSDEESLESSSVEHGLGSYALLQVLEHTSSADENSDGILTVQEVYDGILENFEDINNEFIAYGYRDYIHIPHLSGRYWDYALVTSD